MISIMSIKIIIKIMIRIIIIMDKIIIIMEIKIIVIMEIKIIIKIMEFKINLTSNNIVIQSIY